MKLIKDGVIKDIHGERNIGDYIDAGWKKYELKEIKISKKAEEDIPEPKITKKFDFGK